MQLGTCSRHIAIFIPSLRGGGAERVMLTLANAFAAQGHKVDLVLVRAEGPYLPEVSEAVNIIDLGASRVLRSLWPLSRYLQQEKPDAMLSALNHANVIAILARQIARVPTYLTVSERNSLLIQPRRTIDRLIRRLMRWLYPRADKIICVSKKIEADIQHIIGVPQSKTVTIYNPVDLSAIHEQMGANISHRWFDKQNGPVVLAAGRLTEAKDYPTLLRAFAALREGRDAKLIILGQGKEEAKLKALAGDLNISDAVDFVGFQRNPYAWMARCDLFVLSSALEGFPNVLIQAMACGAKVVSTNCRTGPDEILGDGTWGELVPVGDCTSLNLAMARALDDETPPDGRERVAELNAPLIVDRYARVILP